VQVQAESRRGHRGPELLAVARKLFLKYGYHGTTIERVAKRAGFSKRTVYLYFKNKDELFLSVGEEGLEILRARLEAIPVDALGVEDGIRAILDVYLGFARAHPDYFRIIFQEANADMIANIPPAFRERLEEHERACLGVVVAVADKALREGMVSGMQPWEMAAAFWGAVTGVILLSMGGSQTVFARETREELAEKTVWNLFEGMKRKATGAGP
jgi:AcrR family transcriptional regulator